MAKLNYVSIATVDRLRESIGENADRYRSGDFQSLTAEGEWSIDLDLDVDLAPLGDLDPSGTPEAEIENSKLVWRVLHRLTPALACEEGIWVRLTHIECLGYARQRWLSASMTSQQIEKAVVDHFFADTLTKRRDDNALSRLWWNAYIANLAMPSAELRALQMILKKADVRSNFVERSMTVSRVPLAAGIVRAMEREAWITDKEENFRAFMRTMNRLGGGVVFEVMGERAVDAFLNDCAKRAGLSAAAS